MRSFCVLAACLTMISCQKLNTGICPKPKTTGPLTFEPAKLIEAVPEEYGTPIGVTQDPARPQWVGLWFQKQDETIIAVFMDLERGKLSDRVLTIPRR